MADIIGLQVVVPGPAKATGILRYVGPIQGKPGQFGGVELQGPSAATRGKNSGDVEGVQYFRVSQPMTGLFLPWDRLRSVNSSLVDRPRSRASNGKPDSRTPTLGSRMSSVSSLSRSSSRNASSGSVKVNGHRDSYEGGLSKNTERSVSVVHNVSQPGEIEELRKQLRSKTREVLEKQSVLDELHRTVDELQPLLDDYERSLEAKDKKIKNQKQDHDKAREEWRQCLDLMSSSQQEAESLYEMQISDLKEEINKLRSQLGDTGNLSDPNSYERELKLLREENEALKNSSSQTTEDNDERAELLVKIQRLADDCSSMELVLKNVQAEARGKDALILKLEDEIETLKSKEVADLSGKVGAMSVEDAAEQKATIKSLEDQLSSLQVKFDEEASKNAANLALLKDLKEKESQIVILKEENDKLKAQVASLETNIKSLEQSSATKNKSEEANDQKLLQTVEDLKHELGMRPSFEELTELQDSLEEVEQLHAQELKQKDREIAELASDKAKTLLELQSLRDEIQQLKAPKAAESLQPALAVPKASNGALPIYSPGEHDPSSGRSDWCGLCERDGHDSLNCPYENDIF